MKLGVLANFKKPGVSEFILNLHQTAKNLGCSLLLPENYRSRFAYDCPLQFVDQSQLLGTSDLLITAGGDGTILHAAKLAAPKNLPVLGFNFGRKGFLTTLEASELGRLQEVLAGNCRTEKRLMLEAQVMEKDGEFDRPRQLFAVNDLVIGREFTSKMPDFELAVDGKLLGSYRADGLIFSTPTGTTAYNWAAGGPVLSPTEDSMVITPICPFSGNRQSVVLPGGSQIALQLQLPPKAVCTLVADGRNPVTLSGSVIRIRKSDHAFRLIRMPEQNFYALCKDKLWPQA